MRSCHLFLAPLLLAFNLPLAGAQGKTEFIKDDLSNTFSIGLPHQRIVSLAPNITEILFSLGLGEKVVGVTRYCDYPEEAKDKEKIGGMIDPSLEAIKALEPDLIIAFRGNPIRTLNRLKNFKFPVFILEAGSRLEDVLATVEKMGKITQKNEEAEALIFSMKKKLERTANKLASVNRKPKVFLSLHGQGLWTCGSKSFLNDLLAKAKAENIAGQVPRKWFLFNREQLIHENPEAIVILARSREEFLRAKEWLTNESQFRDIRAVREDRIHRLDENAASRFGPRLFDVLEELARLLHPEIYFKKT